MYYRGWERRAIGAMFGSHAGQSVQIGLHSWTDECPNGVSFHACFAYCVFWAGIVHQLFEVFFSEEDRPAGLRSVGQ